MSDRTAVPPTGRRLHVRVLGPGGLVPPSDAGGRRGGPVLTVRLDGVAPGTRTLLERAVRDAGGESRAGTGDAAPGALGPTIEIRATVEQLRAIGRGALRSEPGFAELAGALDAAVAHRFHRAERVVAGLHRSFRVGGRTAVMGVVNVTPDSFSDGGRFLEPESAVSHALALAAEGAALLDIGGESTRPGAAPVPPDAEWRRVAPVLARLHGRIELPISIDTRRPEVARQALDAGADLVNDVSGLRDPEMRRLLARTGAPAIVMHMRGEPATMQQVVAYTDLVGEVYGALSDACALAESEGIAPTRLLVDPGLGFGKAPGQNLELIAHLAEFRSLGYPVVIGASRKSFLGWVLGGAPLEERGEAGLAAAVAAALGGADVVRVHDVRPAVRALAVADRLRELAPG
jgi:dihydropteroate synthase